MEYLHQQPKLKPIIKNTMLEMLRMTRDDLADLVPFLTDPQEQQEAIRRVREHDAQIKAIEEAGSGDY